MTEYNYCFVKKNKIYEEIYEMIEEEELSMSKPAHTDKIIYEITKIIKKAKYIDIISKSSTSNTNELLEEIMLSLIEENKLLETPGKQGNTLLLHSNDDYYYETLYLENVLESKLNKDDNVNQLISISNIDLEPILNCAAIIKTGYSNGNPVCKSISLDDIIEIVVSNFYHTGIVISDDGNIIELKYSGDNPTLIIGNRFRKGQIGEIYGLSILPWIEEGEKENELASKLLGTMIKGRVFLMTFSPISNRKHWNLTKHTVENILKISDNKEKINQINKELEDQTKQLNPFYLIKKIAQLK
jgi:hypothetical protein